MTKPIEYINITKNKYKICTICIKKQARKSAFDNHCVSVYECRKNHYQTAWQNDFYKLDSGAGNIYNVSVKTDKKFRKKICGV